MHRASALENLAADILHCVKASLANTLRNQNRSSVQTRYQLPVELFDSIWSHLSAQECLAVSQVCHDWRQTAIACPQLWSTTFFTSAEHGNECTCRACENARESRPCPDCGRLSLRRRDCLSRVSTYLERSGGHPVKLSVRFHERSSSSNNAAFATMLAQHVSRLETLAVSFDDLEDLKAFLAPFPAFPVLRTLSLTSLQDSEEWIRLEMLDMPALRSLRLLGSLSLSEHSQLNCPSVTSMKAMFISAGQLLAMMLGCPNVQHLELDVGTKPVDRVDQKTVDGVRELVAAGYLRHLMLSEIYNVDMGPSLELFAGIGIQRFDLNMYRSEIIAADHLRALLQDMEDATNFECHKIGNDSPWRLAISSTKTGRSRTVTTQNQNDEVIELLKTAWAALPPTSLHTITYLRIYSRFWTPLFIAGDQSDVLVTNLTIEFDEEEGFNDWVRRTAVAGARMSARRFPHVESLCLKGVSKGARLEVNIGIFNALWQMLGLSPRLQHMRVEGLRLTGDEGNAETMYQMLSPRVEELIISAD